jgi:hypothetical protein
LQHRCIASPSCADDALHLCCEVKGRALPDSNSLAKNAYACTQLFCNRT